MAGPSGNPNLFKPPNLIPGASPPPPFPSPSHSASPSQGNFPYQPSNMPFHHHPFLYYPQDPLPRPAISHPATTPHLPSPNPNPNPGARLMALLNPHSAQLESTISVSPPSSLSSELPTLAHAPMLNPISPAPVTVSAAQAAPVPSSKLPRGRLLGGGDRVVYDVDSRLPGESQPPQLEVTPITKYTSDPGLVLGRQIAVNRTYICYGLKLGAIRVLNINTALRSLLKGHSQVKKQLKADESKARKAGKSKAKQRVTDMTFFAEDVHILASASVDGRIFVWKIDEGPDEEKKAQITDKIIIAIQVVGYGESYHPRICWHSHKQEILFVGIGNCVLRIDTIKLGRGKGFSADEPLKCPLEKLIDGVQLIGKHDGEVTDLSISQWMITRLVSASKDGTVKIWEDRKAVPLATLTPHAGRPVNAVAFMTSPNRPDHINLITAGPLNREVKLWTSSGEEGWLLSTDSESWQCIQTLELKSSSETCLEEAFFNQIVVLPRANLIIIANAKKNAIYAVHLDYGPFPASTSMDCIADFTVTMPILSLTGTSDVLPEEDQLVQLYCVQTQAIQQYALDLCQCLPAPIANICLPKDTLSSAFDLPIEEGLSVLESPGGSTVSDLPVLSVSQLHTVVSSIDAPANSYPISVGAYGVKNINEHITTILEDKTSAPPTEKGPGSEHVLSSVPVNPEQEGNLAGQNILDKGFKEGSSNINHAVDLLPTHWSFFRRISAPDFTINDDLIKDGFKFDNNDLSVISNPSLMFKHTGNTTHLVTPSEILSGVKISKETSHDNLGQVGEEIKVQDMIVNSNTESEHAEPKDVGECRLEQNEAFDSLRMSQVSIVDNKERSSHTSESKFDVDNEYSSVIETCRDAEPPDTIDQPLSIHHKDVACNMQDIPEKESALTVKSAIPQSLSADKGKRQKSKQCQTIDLLVSSSSPFNSVGSLNEKKGSSSTRPADAYTCQNFSLQEMLNQLMSMQKEMQKQMSAVLAASVIKEVKRVELALGRCMEKAIKASTDALWVRFQEENGKRERAGKEQMQQLTNLITNAMNKELPAIWERILKREISAVGSTIVRAIPPAISAALTESVQRGVSDKAVNQLDKSVSSKLESTISRQIQTQLQSSGKQVVQDALRSCLESSVVPAFEQSCRAMFEQIDCTFKKGMSEHAAASQQLHEAAHAPLALTLRDAISSASSFTQNFTTELLDGQRKLLALVTAGSTKAANLITLQQTNDAIATLPEMALSVQQVEAPMDPKELSRLISEHKYEEAFTISLQRSDVFIVSWLCKQVDLHAICCTVPLPLSQGVLLALVQQLACDISNETLSKVSWMTDVAVQINPADPTIASYVRPIFEQVYNILAHQRSLPTAAASESPNMRLVMHVINSVLMSCK